METDSELTGASVSVNVVKVIDGESTLISEQVNFFDEQEIKKGEMQASTCQRQVLTLEDTSASYCSEIVNWRNAGNSGQESTNGVYETSSKQDKNAKSQDGVTCGKIGVVDSLPHEFGRERKEGSCGGDQITSERGDVVSVRDEVACRQNETSEKNEVVNQVDISHRDEVISEREHLPKEFIHVNNGQITKFETPTEKDDEIQNGGPEKDNSSVSPQALGVHESSETKGKLSCN